MNIDYPVETSAGSLVIPHSFSQKLTLDRSCILSQVFVVFNHFVFFDLPFKLFSMMNTTDLITLLYFFILVKKS